MNENELDDYDNGGCKFNILVLLFCSHYNDLRPLMRSLREPESSWECLSEAGKKW